MARRNIKIIKEEVVEGNIEFTGTLIFTQEKVVVKGNINACDIDAWNIDARNIDAWNIDARNIDAWNEIRALMIKGKIKHGTFVKRDEG